MECVDNSCQICKFVKEFADSVVRKLSVKDVIDGRAQMPFLNRQSWLDSQKQCQDLRKVHALLSLGNRPSKKDTKVRDVKSYLQKVVIARDGLLVVRDVSPLQLDRERIVILKGFIKGLLMAFHQALNSVIYIHTGMWNEYYCNLECGKVQENFLNKFKLGSNAFE